MFDKILNFFSKNKKESKEPYFNLISSGVNEDGVVKLEVDWNDAFIKELRKQGFKGINDEELIQTYVAMIAKHSAEKMKENNSVDISEFI